MAIYNITYEIYIRISFAGSVAVITHSSKGIPMLYLSAFFKVALLVPGHDRTRAGETILNDAIIDRYKNTVNHKPSTERTPVDTLTKKVNSRLAKPPMKLNGGLG